MTGDLWTVHDINNGRVLGRTDEAQSARIFLYTVQQCQRRCNGRLYIVTGVARRKHHREMLDDIKAMDVPIVLDRRAGESLLILEGEPTEWTETELK
jgi:hypothetical protein